MLLCRGCDTWAQLEFWFVRLLGCVIFNVLFNFSVPMSFSSVKCTLSSTWFTEVLIRLQEVLTPSLVLAAG